MSALPEIGEFGIESICFVWTNAASLSVDGVNVLPVINFYLKNKLI